MKAKNWLIIWFITVITALIIVGIQVYRVDPFFHYRKPDTDTYFYVMDNERSQNDGIVKHFTYDAIITGTSLVETFRTSEMDAIFGCNSIKIPFPGASYREINDAVRTALQYNPDVRIVVRCLDISHFYDSSDEMRDDMGVFPTYLYDNNPFNDVEYLLNRDIAFDRAIDMEIDAGREGYDPGITSFDEYGVPDEEFTYGIGNHFFTVQEPEEWIHLSDEQRAVIEENIRLNVTDIADEHPDVDFYYYYPMYSVAWWCSLYNEGSIYSMLEAERYITELILSHDNIHLYSFIGCSDINSDLNNYRDFIHCGPWINSLILEWLNEGRYQLTLDNYDEVLTGELDYLTTFDYESLNGQTDYEHDYYAAALINRELTGAEPVSVYDYCEVDDDYAIDAVYFNVDLDEGYNCLVFRVPEDLSGDGPCVRVYDQDNGLVLEDDFWDCNTDDEYPFAVDLSGIEGVVEIVIIGDCCDITLY